MGNYSSLIMIALLVVVFYFLILRPQKRRQQAIEATQRSLEPGDRVLLGSGILGDIVSIGDRQAVLETSPGVELTVLKQAIARKATPADENTLVEDDDDDELDLPVDAEPVDPGPTSSGPVSSGPVSSGVEPPAQAEPVDFRKPTTPETGLPEQPRSAGADTTRLS